MTSPMYYQYVITYVTCLEKALASLFAAAKSVYKLYRGPLILEVSRIRADPVSEGILSHLFVILEE